MKYAVYKGTQEDFDNAGGACVSRGISEHQIANVVEECSDLIGSGAVKKANEMVESGVLFDCGDGFLLWIEEN